MCEGKCPRDIINTIPSLNDEAHVAVFGDGEAIMVAKSRDIDAGNSASLKNHHALWDFHRVHINEHFN
nr:hypothetical protein CFP56_62234 [Quercus suber]